MREVYDGNQDREEDGERERERDSRGKNERERGKEREISLKVLQHEMSRDSRACESTLMRHISTLHKHRRWACTPGL